MKEINFMKDKRQIKQDIILILLCLLLLLMGIGFFILLHSYRNMSERCQLQISQDQTDIVLPTEKKDLEDAYTELMGFGVLELDRNDPFIYLINPSDNQVYLSFDVIYNNEVLYNSDLIAPGKLESFDVYSCLDAGEHTLTYSISSYDMADRSILWAGVQQYQDILIRK